MSVLIITTIVVQVIVWIANALAFVGMDDEDVKFLGGLNLLPILLSVVTLAIALKAL